MKLGAIIVALLGIAIVFFWYIGNAGAMAATPISAFGFDQSIEGE